MKRTDAFLGRVALAVSLGIVASSAHAVPIVFDFVGTVTSTNMAGSAIGQSVAGRFVVETDGLVARTRTTASGTGVTYNDFPVDSVDLITSEVMVGGIAYDAGAYASDQSFVSAFDSSGVPACEGCSINPDYAVLQDWSMAYWPLDGSSPLPPPGLYAGRRLQLMWSSSALDFIDLSSGFEPLDLVSTLSTLLPTGYLSEETYHCADRACSGAASARVNFSVASLTIHTPSVPEPGTLALFGIGLLGGAVARRSAVKGR